MRQDDHPPNSVPTPNAAPAEIAPITMVSRLDIYHLALVTKLLLNPNTNKKNAATNMVVSMKFLLSSILLTFAIIIGIKGMSPKMQKLKKVTKLFLKGFSSPVINLSY